MAKPIYLQFTSLEPSNTWLSLSRSYAIREISGSQLTPADGGLYRMWRQVELSIIQGRNLGIQTLLTGSNPHTGSIVDSTADAVDLYFFCEIRFNEQLCGRTTVKRSIGPPN